MLQNGPPRSNIPATMEAYIAPLKEPAPTTKPVRPKWGGADYCVRCCKYISCSFAMRWVHWHS